MNYERSSASDPLPSIIDLTTMASPPPAPLRDSKMPKKESKKRKESKKPKGEKRERKIAKSESNASSSKEADAQSARAPSNKSSRQKTKQKPTKNSREPTKQKPSGRDLQLKGRRPNDKKQPLAPKVLSAESIELKGFGGLGGIKRTTASKSLCKRTYVRTKRAAAGPTFAEMMMRDD